MFTAIRPGTDLFHVDFLNEIVSAHNQCMLEMMGLTGQGRWGDWTVQPWGIGADVQAATDYVWIQEGVNAASTYLSGPAYRWRRARVWVPPDPPAWLTPGYMQGHTPANPPAAAIPGDILGPWVFHDFHAALEQLADLINAQPQP